MAVTYVSQQPNTSGSQNADGSDDNLTFLVVFDDASTATGAEAMSADAGDRVPQVGEIADGKRVTELSYSRDADNPHVFTVTATLSSSQPEQNEGDKAEVSIDIASEKFEEVVYLDFNRKPIMNPAGQVFTNQPTKTYSDERISVSFKTATVPQAAIDRCIQQVNSGTVTMTVKGYPRRFATGTLKFDDYRVSAVVVADAFWWQVSYTLLYRRDGWKKRIIAMGMNERKEAGAELTAIRDKNGIEVSSDVPLDKDGKAIKDVNIATVAKLITDAAAGELCYQEFQMEDRVSFTSLLSGISTGPQAPI